MKAIHDAVEAAVSEPTDGVLLLQRVQAQRVAVRRRRLAVAGVLVSLSAVLTAIALVSRPAHETSAPTDPAPDPRAVDPASTQTVSYRGLQVVVPAAWPVRPNHCLRGPEDFIAQPGFSIDTGFCGPLPGPLTTSALFFPLPSLTSYAAATPTFVSGQPARLSVVATPEHTSRVTLTVRSHNVMLSVQAPTKEAALRIVNTATLVAQDEHGCVVQRNVVVKGAPSESGALLPHPPTSMSLCEYKDGMLEASAQLRGEPARAFATALNALVITSATVRHGCSPIFLSTTFEVMGDVGGAPLHLAAGGVGCESVPMTDGTRTVSLGRLDLTFLVQRSIESNLTPPGTVTGALERVGGPMGTPNVRVPGTIMFSSPSFSARATADDDGSFRIVLPPGRYAVRGTSPQVAGTTCTSPPALVTREGRLSLRLFCSIP